jgi:hypothetical protein
MGKSGSCHHAEQYHQEELLQFDVANWPPYDVVKRYKLCLEDTTHYDVTAGLRSKERNLSRIEKAKSRPDIAHMEVQYCCCIDHDQRVAIESLLQYDGREWVSFTMTGINGIEDLYADATAAEQYLYSFFLRLTTVKVLNLYSCISNRGHGLETILKAIPNFDQLKELRIEGWQMDGVSIRALAESLQFQHMKSISLLSLRSCLFLGEGAFNEMITAIHNVPNLEHVNVSYCNLGDNEIISLVNSLRAHPSINTVHLEGNFCGSQLSVSSIADWIKDPACNLHSLNTRGLWIGFSEEGLVQRYVNLMPIFDALSMNLNLRSFTISENYLEDNDVIQLAVALLESPDRKLTSLDVGDNPFQEAGARSLLEVVQTVRTLRFVRFENNFLQYSCADHLKLLAEFNRYDPLLLDNSAHIPMPLWSLALSRIQEQHSVNYFPDDTTRSMNILYRMLQSSTGPFGQQLLLRIAMLGTEGYHDMTSY